MVINVLVYFSSFIIGVVLGGMAVFIFRRLVVNRQIRISQRKAARMVAEARNEVKDVLNEAREEFEKAAQLDPDHAPAREALGYFKDRT